MEKVQNLAADLLQGFPGPKPLKNIEKNCFGVLGVGGGPPLGPVGCLVAYVGSSLIWPYGLLMVHPFKAAYGKDSH